MVFDVLENRQLEGRDYTDPTLQPVITAGAYGANDAVGGLIKFSGASLRKAGPGFINGWTIIDYGQVKAALKLFLFDRLVTVAADNAAFTISDADMRYCIGVLATGSYIDVAAVNSIYPSNGITPISYRAYAGNTLYGQLMTTGTPTYAATTGLTIKLHVSIAG